MWGINMLEKLFAFLRRRIFIVGIHGELRIVVKDGKPVHVYFNRGYTMTELQQDEED